MVIAAASEQPLLRYWLTSPRDFHGGLNQGHIRLEWVDATGVTRTSYGSFWPSDAAINWQHEDPPAALDELAIECAFDAGEYGVSGCEFVGLQTSHQMSQDCDR